MSDEDTQQELNDLREEYDSFKRPADYLIVRTEQCGCGRTRIWRQSHCFCAYEYQVEGIAPTLELHDEDDQFYHTFDRRDYWEEREIDKQAKLRKKAKLTKWEEYEPKCVMCGEWPCPTAEQCEKDFLEMEETSSC